MLTLLKARVKRDSRYNYYHLYLCQCGNKFITLQNSVRRGLTTSCGCVSKRKSSERARKMSQQNVKHGMCHTREYQTWDTMIQRCTNPNATKYYNYGGRGITICDEWRSFENFYKDMGPRPELKTLDRIDNEKGYYKENCRWATASEQCLNRRKRKK
jgi:hypothetical protein